MKTIKTTLALAALAMMGLGANAAHAQVSACRTDPILTLTNGTQLTLYEDVYDTAADITAINYQVHVPLGVKVKSVQYSGAVPAGRQTIAVYSDQLVTGYNATTKVSTVTSGISVTAYMSTASLGGLLTFSTRNTGTSNQVQYSYLLL